MIRRSKFDVQSSTFSALLLCLVSTCSAQFGGLRSPAFVAALAPNAASATFPSGVWYYYTLDETSGNARTETAAGGSDLNETTTAVASTTGKKNNAANWPPGTGTLENGIGFGDASLPLTVAFWVNVDNLPASSSTFIGGNDPDDPYCIITSAGNVSLGNGSDGVLVSVALGTLDTWHLIVFTGTGVTWSLSVDGSALTSGTSTGTPAGTSIILGTIATLDAAIDELAIWQRVLTQTEVNNLWNGGAGTFGP